MRGGGSIAGVLAALVPLFLFRKGAMGGGDVKLFAALGALVGFELGISIVLNSFVVMLVIAFASVLYKGQALRMMRNVGTMLVNAFRPAAHRKVVASEALSWFRMGPAIFLAVCVQTLFEWRWR